MLTINDFVNFEQLGPGTQVETYPNGFFELKVCVEDTVHKNEPLWYISGTDGLLKTLVRLQDLQDADFRPAIRAYAHAHACLSHIRQKQVLI